jgi:XTP/dITP diphosphohydrolase
VLTAEGRCAGSIATDRSGNSGFGYDPLFVVDGIGKRMAELSAEQKAAVSHRGHALRSILAQMRAVTP